MDKVKVRKLYVKNKRICGFGINDAEYPTQALSGSCLIYRRWASMINRAYGNHPSNLAHGSYYVGVTVSNEWQYFSDFKRWYEENSVFGWELDKDLLIPDNKEYGPDTCVFIPHQVNTMIQLKLRTKWNTLPGVTYEARSKTKPFIVDSSVVAGVQSRSGLSNEYAANEYYRKRKAKGIHHLINDNYYGDVINGGLSLHRDLLLNPPKDSRYVLRRSLGKPVPDLVN